MNVECKLKCETLKKQKYAERQMLFARKANLTFVGQCNTVHRRSGNITVGAIKSMSVAGKGHISSVVRCSTQDYKQNRWFQQNYLQYTSS